MIIVSLAELQVISQGLDEVELQQSCNVHLLDRLQYELPLALPFGFGDCLTKQSEYRLWCSLRADVISKIRTIKRG